MFLMSLLAHRLFGARLSQIFIISFQLFGKQSHMAFRPQDDSLISAKALVI